MAAGMPVRAGVAAPSTAAASTATTAATTPAFARRIAIGFGRLAHFARLARIAGFPWLARTLGPAGDLVGRPVESPDHLAERLDLALVGGLLALGLLDQFEKFVHRLRGRARR